MGQCRNYYRRADLLLCCFVDILFTDNLFSLYILAKCIKEATLLILMSVRTIALVGVHEHLMVIASDGGGHTSLGGTLQVMESDEQAIDGESLGGDKSGVEEIEPTSEQADETTVSTSATARNCSSRLLESRIILDNYPIDLLQKIVGMVGFDSLSKMLSISFFKLNRNIEEAVNSMISNSIYRFSNSVLKPVWDEFHQCTSDFTTFESFQAFDNYCVKARLETTIRISFTLKHFVDLIQLQKLLYNLKPSNVVKLDLTLDLRPYQSSCIDLTQPLAALDWLRGRLTRFSLTAPDKLKVQGQFKLNQLRELEINGRSLKKLWHKSKGLDLAKLKSLKSLTCDVGSLRNNSVTKLPALEKISLSSRGDLPVFFEKLLCNITSSETTSIEYKAIEGNASDFAECLNEAAKFAQFELKSLSLAGALGELSIYPTELLELRRTDNPELIRWLRLPPTLKLLTLTEQWHVCIGEILTMIPLGVEYLHLSGFDEGICDSGDLTQFSNLKFLKLSRCGVKNFEANMIQFPESLRTLDLSGNHIRSIDGIAFPKQLLSLNVSFNRIRNIQGDRLPLTLKHITVTPNPIKCIHLLKNEFGEELPIDSLSVNTCKGPLEGSTMAPNAQNLFFKNLVLLNDCSFSDKLVRLRLDDCVFLDDLRFAAFPRLKYLCIKNCHQLGIELPETLEELELSQIYAIPPELALLENLRHLRLSGCIKYPEIEFQSNLESLELTFRGIKRLDLRFPKGVTNLKHIDLSRSRLESISIECIGCRDGSLHKNLVAVGLSKYTCEHGNINRFISQLQKATNAKWTHHSMNISNRGSRGCLIRGINKFTVKHNK